MFRTDYLLAKNIQRVAQTVISSLLLSTIFTSENWSLAIGVYVVLKSVVLKSEPRPSQKLLPSTLTMQPKIALHCSVSKVNFPPHR